MEAIAQKLDLSYAVVIETSDNKVQKDEQEVDQKVEQKDEQELVQNVEPENLSDPADKNPESSKNARIITARKKFVKYGRYGQNIKNKQDASVIVKPKQKYFINKSEINSIPFTNEQLELEIANRERLIFLMKMDKEKVLEEHDNRRNAIVSSWDNRIEMEIKQTQKFYDLLKNKNLKQIHTKNEPIEDKNFTDLVTLLNKYPIGKKLRPNEAYRGHTYIIPSRNNQEFVQKLECALNQKSINPNYWVLDGHIFFDKVERDVLRNNKIKYENVMLLSSEDDPVVKKYGNYISFAPKYDNLQIVIDLLNKYPKGTKFEGMVLQPYTVVFPYDGTDDHKVPRELIKKFTDILPEGNISDDAWVLQEHITFTDEEIRVLKYFNMKFAHIREPDV